MQIIGNKNNSSCTICNKLHFTEEEIQQRCKLIPATYSNQLNLLALCFYFQILKTVFSTTIVSVYEALGETSSETVGPSGGVFLLLIAEV